MSCAYGAIWRKWDFHIHTPYSILNNNYGFNPFEMDESMLESAFDEFVTTLFTKAIDNNIAAIGITDYFMLEGCKRIKHKYLASPEKMLSRRRTEKSGAKYLYIPEHRIAFGHICRKRIEVCQLSCNIF